MKNDDYSDCRHGLLRLLCEAAHRHTLYDVFRDFCEAGAISLSNAVDMASRVKREARYLEIVKKYDAETVKKFPQMLGCLVGELENGSDDVLGRVYMDLELANKDSGQFFTPYSLCQTIAGMQMDDSLKDIVAKNGFVTVNEPACGGGAMLIAFAEAMRAAGLNPQRQMHAVAQDIDPRAVHMTYLQLSLLHIPAVVLCGNTITMEVTDQWFTPAHVIGGWNWKLKKRDQEQSAPLFAENQVQTTPAPDVTLPAGEQIPLFL